MYKKVSVLLRVEIVLSVQCLKLCGIAAIHPLHCFVTDIYLRQTRSPEFNAFLSVIFCPLQISHSFRWDTFLNPSSQGFESLITFVNLSLVDRITASCLHTVIVKYAGIQWFMPECLMLTSSQYRHPILSLHIRKEMLQTRRICRITTFFAGLVLIYTMSFKSFLILFAVSWQRGPLHLLQVPIRHTYRHRTLSRSWPGEHHNRWSTLLSSEKNIELSHI